MIAAFLVNLLFARYFGAAESGRIFYLFAVLAVAIQVGGLSLESGVSFYAANGKIDDNRLLTSGMLWAIGVTLVLTVFLYGLLPDLMFDVLPAYTVAFVFGNMLIALGNGYAYSKLRFALPGMLAVAINLALVAGILVVKHIDRLSWFVPAYFFSFALQGLILFALLAAGSGPLRWPTGRNWRYLFRYSLPAFAGNLLFLLMNRADYFFVDRFCRAQELGNYIQVSKIAQLFFMLPSMVATVLFPLVAGASGAYSAGGIPAASRLIVAIYLPALLIPALAGAWLFTWLYGADFSGMYHPFLLLIPGILAISSLYPYTAYYAATGGLRINVVGSALGLLVIGAGDLVFIPRFGITAAALVSSAGYFAFQLYVLSRFSRQFRIPLRSLLIPGRQDYLYLISRIRFS